MSVLRNGGEAASPNQETAVFSIAEGSQVGEARRAARALAEAVGLDEAGQGRLALVLMEAATNMLRYAEHGELLMRPIATSDRRVGVELIAIDRGPGMVDVARCLADGYSSAASQGSGLGAMRRHATVFDIFSSPRGTAILLQVLGNAAERELRSWPSPADVGAVTTPFPGETVVGDGWASKSDAESAHVMVVDGLGHGVGAADAARAAEAAFLETPTSDPAEMLRVIHQALIGGRGAALALASIDFATRRVRYAGIGNVVGMVIGCETRSHMVSHNGILGYEARRFQTFEYPWTPGATLLMHTDGLGTKWDLGQYPGLSAHHPSLIAAVIHRDHRRGRDDATIVVMREPGHRQNDHESR